MSQLQIFLISVSVLALVYFYAETIVNSIERVFLPFLYEKAKPRIVRTYIRTLPQLRKPQNGDKIELTWLPNPINNPEERSCYIGSRGTVEGLDDDGFVLRMESGAQLLVHGKKYRFKRL